MVSEVLYKQETLIQRINCLKVDLLFLGYCKEAGFLPYITLMLDSRKIV